MRCAPVTHKGAVLAGTGAVSQNVTRGKPVTNPKQEGGAAATAAAAAAGQQGSSSRVAATAAGPRRAALAGTHHACRLPCSNLL